MNNDQVGGGVFLGLILFGFFLWLVSRITTVAFIAIGKMLDAIGSATISFLGMVWALVQIAGILALGALLIYAAYKFIVLIKNGTAIVEQAEKRIDEAVEQITAENKALESRVSKRMWALTVRLEEALKEPEAAPSEQPPANVEPQVPQPAPANVSPTQEVVPEQQPIATNESTAAVFNRY